MRALIVLLALAGALVSALAWRSTTAGVEDFFTVTDDWDCGVVNRSPYAQIGAIPVATIGIVGYLALAGLALMDVKDKLAIAASLGMAFSLYLSYIEKQVLRAYCQYCVISQIDMLLLLLLCVGWWWAHRQKDIGETPL